jgi:hypothetical protein
LRVLNLKNKSTTIDSTTITNAGGWRVVIKSVASHCDSGEEQSGRNVSRLHGNLFGNVTVECHCIGSSDPVVCGTDSLSSTTTIKDDGKLDSTGSRRVAR